RGKAAPSVLACGEAGRNNRWPRPPASKLPFAAQTSLGRLRLFFPHPERRHESLLRNTHVAVFPHPRLALLLLFQQLLLAADVAAIALRRHVLAQRSDRLAGDHLAADRRLDRD